MVQWVFIPDKHIGEYTLGDICIGKVIKLNVGQREKALY